MDAVGASGELAAEAVADGALKLSVIVPLAPGELAWLALLAQLRALPEGSEVIVVHADSSRQPVGQWPTTIPLRHCETAPGRARQQNLGAGVARGRWLWFVHADSQLLPATLPALQRFIARTHDALGYFDLRFDNDGPRLAVLNAWGANLRSHWLKLPFGDQGLLLPAARFATLGGFDERADYGEDHLLIWTARAAGLPIESVGAPLRTSARKYARQGWLRTTVRHGWLTARQAWPAWRSLPRQAR
jgi:rSAM/selenodomain-associated transferase 2